MARTLTRNSQVYPAGTYGPFSIDAFTKDDADRIELSLTIEAWPDVPKLLSIAVTLSDGSGFTCDVPGRPKNRDGTDQTVFRCSIAIPQERPVVDGVIQAPRKRNVSSSQASVVVHEAFRTALTLAAV